jgi:hypothetical protein
MLTTESLTSSSVSVWGVSQAVRRSKLAFCEVGEDETPRMSENGGLRHFLWCRLFRELLPPPHQRAFPTQSLGPVYLLLLLRCKLNLKNEMWGKSCALMLLLVVGHAASLLLLPKAYALTHSTPSAHTISLPHHQLTEQHPPPFGVACNHWFDELDVPASLSSSCGRLLLVLNKEKKRLETHSVLIHIVPK